jgi:hypothetical protein
MGQCLLARDWGIHGISPGWREEVEQQGGLAMMTVDAEATEPTLLTKEEILDHQHFREAMRGGMDMKHYTTLCSMALACLGMLKEDS